MVCAAHDLGWTYGKSRAHDEVRAWEPAGHHPTCGCDPCQSGKAVLEKADRSAVLVEHEPDESQPELSGRYAVMLETVRSRQHEDYCAEHCEGNVQGDCWCPCHSRDGGAQN